MSYWTVKKTYPRQDREDENEYSLLAGKKTILKITGADACERLQQVANSHNMEK